MNQEAEAKIAEWRSALSAEAKAKSAANVNPYKPYHYLDSSLHLSLALFFPSVFTSWVIRETISAGISAVFLVATLAYFLAAQSQLKAWGLEYVLWAIILGFLVSNTVGTPKLILAAARPEYFIKTGLVLLGSTILMNKILLIGIPGVVVTWVVTPIVLISTFWFGQKILKIESPELNITISADMSVSGVSAAIAAGAASRAKKEEITLAIGISILFTAFMMVVMPLAIRAIGMHHVLRGHGWVVPLTLTGAVVAAGEIWVRGQRRGCYH